MKEFFGYKNKSEIFANQEQLFSTLFSIDITAKTKVRSPLRYDSKAGCIFRKLKGKIYFLDFTQTPPGYNIIRFYAALKKISEDEAESILYKIISGDEKEIKLRKDYTVNLRNKNNNGTSKFLWSERKWTKEDTRYWGQFGLNKKNLEEIIPISSIKMFNDVKDLINISYYKPAYLIRIIERSNIFKAYCPNCKKDIKWFTNATNNHVGNLSYFDKKKEYVIIEKSFKDSKILNNFGINNLYFQNEGQLPNNDILVELLNSINIIIIIFDNDGAGKQAAKNVQNKLKTLFVHKPIITILEREDYRYSDIAEERQYNKTKFKSTIIFLRKSIKFIKKYAKSIRRRNNEI